MCLRWLIKVNISGFSRIDRIVVDNSSFCVWLGRIFRLIFSLIRMNENLLICVRLVEIVSVVWLL